MFEIGVQLQCNGGTVLLLYSAVGSTWMDGSIRIQRLGTTMARYHRCTIVFSLRLWCADFEPTSERIAVLKGLENQRIDDFTIAYTTTRYFILINHPYFGYNTEGGI
ncbi:hypothetical protein CISIN_1g043886mg [Citrus sinensis]|uniref:Uncharacterized protein n=1 Tax=Citrus sinensis TaxID=2711 RepID=A0A067CZU1_CITSI|nr:hypothetical protein CISIN_1g043886mg [Citrus sinensis]